jgi:hypothetical protein
MQNLWIAGRLDETDAEAHATLQLFPDAYFAHFFLGLTAWRRGDPAGAVAGAQKAVDALGPVPVIVSHLAAMYYYFDQAEQGDEILAMLRRRASESYVSSGAFAVIHVARGEIDEAIRWLRIGRANRDSFFCQLKTLITHTPLPMDPRLAEQFDRLGFR